MEFTLEAASNPFADLEAFFRRLERPGNGEVRKIADAVTQGFQSNFTGERSAQGAWAQLAQSTVLDRIAQGYGGSHPILRREDDVLSSWVDRNAPDHHEQFQPQAGGWQLEVGSNNPMAAFHEKGTSRMPARPVADLTDDAENRITSVLEFIIDQIQAQTVGR